MVDENTFYVFGDRIGTIFDALGKKSEI